MATVLVISSINLEALITAYAIATAITARLDAAIIVAIPPGPKLGRIPEKVGTIWQPLEYRPLTLYVVLA